VIEDSDRVFTVAPDSLPKGWRAASLPDLIGPQGLFIDGDWVESKDQDPSGDVRLIQLADVGDGTYRNRSDRFMTLESAKRLGCTFLKAGDLLIARMPDPLGRACLFPGDSKEAVTVVDVAVVRPENSDVNTRWLMYSVNAPQFRKAVASLQSGSTRQRISRRNLSKIVFALPPPAMQRAVVAEIEKQFSRLDEAVANLKRVKANLRRYERAVITAVTNPDSFNCRQSGVVDDFAYSLDNMRKPVNKTERAKRVGAIPYLGANGRTGWIDEHLFEEELVLVVEDETFVGRQAPFSYYFASKCWVNNHTHVLRARKDRMLPKYLNLALSYYPFIPLTTGSTGRRKLTKKALMTAPLTAPSIAEQEMIIADVERRFSLLLNISAEVDSNLLRAERLRSSILAGAFAGSTN
jgi:restriction endonuclease S subunit